MAWGLRRRLAVRFSLTMAVALLAIALWAYLGVRESLREQLDIALQSTLERESFMLERAGQVLPTPTPVEQDRFVREINRLVVVRDSAGRILQTNNPLAQDLPLDSAALGHALAGRRSAVDGLWRGAQLRSFYGPAPPAATPGRVVQVSASRGALDAASRKILYRMILTALLGALVTLVGAGWLARSALAPVEAIAGEARVIQGAKTGERITTHADIAELQGLIEVLNQMLARLERAHEWHRRIIRDLGHDLRTPITTMRAAVELALSTQRRPDEYRQVLASTLDEIDRLALIGDALSLLGRLEAGDLRPVIQPVDLRHLTAQAVDRATARVNGDHVRFGGSSAAVLARVDARLIGMALDQLLDNARRHTPPGTPVQVGMGATNGRVTLTVEDQGPGVPEEMLPHLFDRFYRGDTARGPQAGAGLGLAMVATIVDLHGGSVAAERGDGGGLRIRVELPQ